MGDFTGFTFGGYHSFNDLGITRVSGGDRYEEELHPEVKDRTAEVVGLNGDYYFGSEYGPRKFDLDIAFDSLTEKQFRNLRKVFGTKKVKDLIFDERPYKKYLAKIESPVELSYVCFDEPKKHVGTKQVEGGIRWVNKTVTTTVNGEEVTTTTRVREDITPYVHDEGTQRIYKGEGKISFVCHFPFAKSVYKVLPEGSDEWAISSGILSGTNYDGLDEYNGTLGGIEVYNAGDIDTGFRLYLPGAVTSAGTTLTYQADENSEQASLVIHNITLKSNGVNNDVGVIVDTTNDLIIGVAAIDTTDDDPIGSATLSSNIYNEYVTSGYFFHLEPNIVGETSNLLMTNGTSNVLIDYDYLYF